MNSRRHTITSLSIVFLAVTIMSVSAFGQDAFAGHGAGAGMSLSVDCSGSSCDISGTTDRNDEPVMLVITQANGNIVNIGQLDVDHGEYSATWAINAGIIKVLFVLFFIVRFPDFVQKWIRINVKIGNFAKNSE